MNMKDVVYVHVCGRKHWLFIMITVLQYYFKAVFRAFLVSGLKESCPAGSIQRVLCSHYLCTSIV